MIFGSYKSEWSDSLARCLARIACEKPVGPIQGKYYACGKHFAGGIPCPPCSARQYVEHYPSDAGDPPEATVPA